MNSFAEFIQEDHKGHLERSGEELTRHADRSLDIGDDVRQKYFYGITTMFPLMLLGHYYQWRTGKEPKEYMEQFVPAEEKKLAPLTTALLDAIYAPPQTNEAWVAAVSAYLAAVPFEVLTDFALWAGIADREKLADVIIALKKDVIPQLVTKLASCTDNEARVKTVLYLGGDLPFQLLEKFQEKL
jgi:hypothetical protein